MGKPVRRGEVPRHHLPNPKRWKAGWLAVALVLSHLAIAGCAPASPEFPTSSEPPRASPSASASATPPPAAKVVITEVPPDNIGRVEVVVDDPATILTQPDNQPYSPSTFFVKGDTITLENRVAGTLNVYRKGKKVDQFRSPDTCCSDLLIDSRGHYWILGDEEVDEYVRKPGAKKLTHLSTHPAGEDQPTWLFQDGDNIYVKQSEDDIVLISGPGPLGPVPKTEILDRSVTASDGEQLNVEIKTRTAAVGLRMLGRTADYYYLKVTESSKKKWGTVYQLTRAGAVVNTYNMLPPEDKLPWREVQISPDGQVYQMVISNETTRIYRLPPNP